MEDDPHWKTTSNGRQPPMDDNLQWKMTYNGRRPQHFNGKPPKKKVKVEYLSNHLLDHTQILNLSLDDPTIVCKSFK